ncbi:MAG: hypothetical protein V9G23_01830 [Giesbergeria sp.]
MKPFALDSSHTNMSGVFYPTGHIFALFPTADLARRAADALDTAGEIGESAYASPEVIQKDIVRTLGSSDAVLPSVGAESDLVRRIADLASTGHHGLLVEVGKHDDTEVLAATLQREGAVAAFYYRTLVIEDLIEQPPHRHEAIGDGGHARGSAAAGRALQADLGQC